MKKSQKKHKHRKKRRRLLLKNLHPAVVISAGAVIIFLVTGITVFSEWQVEKVHPTRVFQPALSPASPFFIQVSTARPGSSGLYLCDGNHSTVWQPQPGEDNWFEIHFPEKRIMDHIVLYTTHGTPQKISEYRIQVYYHEHWIDLLTNMTVHWSNRHLLEAVDARAVRIFIPAHALKRGGGFTEIALYLSETRLNIIDWRLFGFALPYRNAVIPSAPAALPNAPRAYRHGIHKGIDFSHINDRSGTHAAPHGTPLRAIKDGIVIRVDTDFTEPPLNEWIAESEYLQQHQETYAGFPFGGRTLWIDHGEGIVSVYNHLASIAPGICVGKKVSKRQVIGTMGNSGMYAAHFGTESTHLHLEIWVDGHYFGKGMNPSVIHCFLQAMFEP